MDERAWRDGTIARRPSAAELKHLSTRLKRAGVESIAICFLHAYRNAANERAVAKALMSAGVYVCASHEISPEFREYERASTTAVNAYVGPLMDAYLEELDRARGFRISIMQSNGGFLAAREAGRHAVRTVLSGPAGGVVGAIETARASGLDRVLGFDMGGTSTDVSLAVGTPRETTEAMLDGFPIRVPMLDIHTVGAGGGSIARVDAGGLLRVGPESAGADPGPACYGAGDQPTVTDAHVVLGRIDALLGGALALDRARAEAPPSIRLGASSSRARSRTAAAAGIVRVANANMERAIRVVSVERGHDPRDLALLAFGGCGGLHACEMAAELGIRTVIVPEHAGRIIGAGHVAWRMRCAIMPRAVLGSADVEGAIHGTGKARAAAGIARYAIDRAQRGPALSGPELRTQRALGPASGADAAASSASRTCAALPSDIRHPLGADGSGDRPGPRPTRSAVHPKLTRGAIG